MQKDETIKKACFFARDDRNHAGFPAKVDILAYGTDVPLDPPRYASASVRLRAPASYSATSLGTILTRHFNVILFGTKEEIREVGDAWYAQLPQFQEKELLRMYHQHRKMRANSAVVAQDFLLWLAKTGRTHLLAHIIQLPSETTLRLRARAETYHLVHSRGQSDVEMAQQSADTAATQIAERLRNLLQSLTLEEQRINQLQQQLTAEPQVNEALRQRTKYAVRSFVEDIPQEIQRRQEARAILERQVQGARRELEHQQLRVSDFKEFLAHKS